MAILCAESGLDKSRISGCSGRFDVQFPQPFQGDDVQNWQDIPGYEGKYQIDRSGQVRSLDRIDTYRNGALYPRKGCLLRQHVSVGGYWTVALPALDRKGQSTKQVHRLLMLTFVGPPPSPKHHVCHQDGNPTNNALGNLRYGTAKENRADAVRHGTSRDGERHGMARLTTEDVLRIRSLPGKVPVSEIAAQHGISQDHVSDIVRGKTWILPEHFPPGWVAAGHHANAKLTAVQVRLIRSISKQFTQREIADLFCIEQSNVSLIIRGATWRRAEYQPVTARAA